MKANKKQTRLLARYGVDASVLTHEQASQLVLELAKNGWVKPVDLGENQVVPPSPAPDGDR